MLDGMEVQQLHHDEVEALPRRELAGRFECVRRCRAALAAYEARLVRAADALDDDGLDGAGMLRVAGLMPSRQASAVADRAEALASLPRAGRALADGRITAEHASAIVSAAEKVSPERADAELVPEGAAPPADVFAKRCREWSSRNRDDDGADDHERQRAARSLRGWQGRDGMNRWMASIDSVAGEEVGVALEREYDRLWRADGGREGSPDEVRTYEQRMADAFVNLITGARPADTTPPHPRAQLLVTADISRLRADDPDGVATTIDGEPLPQAVLERLACNSEMTAVLFDGPGRPIWVGRNHRAATIAQWKALIARDRGCVGCGARPNRCEAHHIVAWLDLGPTDITNLVLVCSRCHHDLHDRGMQLVALEDGWQIAPRAGPRRCPSPADAAPTEQVPRLRSP